MKKEQAYTTQFYFKTKIAYAVIPKKYLQDKDLTLKAKGLLSIIYSLPDEWNYSIKGLLTITGIGEKQLINTLHELEEKHYIYKGKGREKNGKFKYTYIVFVEPTDWEEY